ncbi:hypothetical protein DFH09DRAFT_1086688 [Mycena vulgaris]|nr:hypothetical protein DFH09DRAFT_1086688 [Mycena vulgaris]
MKHTDVGSRLDGDNNRCVHHVEKTDLERNRTRLFVGGRPRLYRVLSAISDFCAVRNACESQTSDFQDRALAAWKINAGLDVPTVADRKHCCKIARRFLVITSEEVARQE